MTEKLQVGDRVQLSGGYDAGSTWLADKEAIYGRDAKFIPGQNTEPAALIKLDEPLTGDGVTGDFIVLELRYAETKWGPTETVHVELCDFEPEEKRWQDRQQGEWVESHATYKRV
jgi:hypothetical protein